MISAQQVQNPLLAQWVKIKTSCNLHTCLHCFNQLKLTMTQGLVWTDGRSSRVQVCLVVSDVYWARDFNIACVSSATAVKQNSNWDLVWTIPEHENVSLESEHLTNVHFNLNFNLN